MTDQFPCVAQIYVGPFMRSFSLLALCCLLCFQLYTSQCYVSSCTHHNVMFPAVHITMLCFQLYTSQCYVSSCTHHNVMFPAVHITMLCFQLYTSQCYVSSCTHHNAINALISAGYVFIKQPLISVDTEL